jgi:hypothetical protein
MQKTGKETNEGAGAVKWKCLSSKTSSWRWEAWIHLCQAEMAATNSVLGRAYYSWRGVATVFGEGSRIFLSGEVENYDCKLQ